jgi:signal transduction histidine kinase
MEPGGDLAVRVVRKRFLSVIKLQQELDEARRLERVFTFHRWLYIPGVLLTAWLYGWFGQPLVMLVIAGLALANMVAHLANGRISTVRGQAALGAGLFAVDGLAAWGLIILGMASGQGAIYVVFALIIVEAAMRYGLWGSLATDIVFALGLYLLWLYMENPGVNFVPADYLVLVGVLSFVSLMVGMVAREWRKQRRYAEHLAAEKALLLERRRISNELHDSVLKSLQGLALEAHALGRDNAGGTAHPVAERAAYIEDVCGQLSREIRAVILGLRDDGESEDLVRHITGLVKSWSEKSGVAVEFTHGGDIPAALQPKLAHDLLRVLEEELANVARHAGASRVEVSLMMKERHLHLEVRDNGCGFAVDAGEIYAFVRRGKLGLVSMKERVELAGGRFAVESGQAGTVLTAVIPLPGGERAEPSA